MMKKALATRPTGRDREKAAGWRRMIRGQAGSGLSIRGWCRRHGLRESAFYWWRTQLARRDAEASTPTRNGKSKSATLVPDRVVESGSTRRKNTTWPAFVPVRVAACPSADDASNMPWASEGLSRMEIILPQGRRVHVIGPVDRQALTDVLAVLSNDLISGDGRLVEPGVKRRSRRTSRGRRPC